ncbi:MAG: T9SS type A sorting domain-containing protein [Clostridia bacterium]|nr:T9SS type A sorting domain-containing protein [Clostridia bacterium]
MKTKLLWLIIMIAIPLWIAAQTYEAVPFQTIKEIADRNAQALWGDFYPAEPIPYYGFDDEIIAWRFNYSIGKPFPAKEDLLDQIKRFENENDAYNQWGGDNYGRILIGARENMPVLLEYSRCLSAEYALGNKIKKLAKDAHPGKSAFQGKIYYLNHFDTWHEVISENTIKYVCTSPTGGILDALHFDEMKAQTEIFCETGDFSSLWNSYKNGFVAPTDGDKYIPYHECMPYYDWSYGCSPTAAAMIFAWYDYRSLWVASKYPSFVGWHYQRFDNRENETDYNVCNLQLDLALAMSTDTMTGSTQSYNIDNGMSWVANHQRKYNFDIVNRYTFLWTRLTDDIDAGKPLLVSIPGHSTAGVGYNGSSDMAITHYTYDPPRHLVWVSRWDIDMITRVSSGGQKGSAIQLTRPVGDPRYNRNGNGEVYSAGNYAEITWLSDNVPGAWVDLLYSTDGGHSFETIVSGTENDGVYNWLIPSDINSSSCRVIAYLRTPEMEPYFAGADGSWGNFIINNAGAISTMINEHLYSHDSLPGYHHFQHTEPSWAAIGAKSDFGNCNWEIQLYNNTNFNQNPAFYSTFDSITNFIVVDGNHYPSSLRGIKITPLDDHRPVQLEYEGGNENLVFGTNGPYAWNANEIVEMKEIHLTPGRYYFELETTSGWPDLGMALYGSTDAIYLKPQSFNIGYANYASGNGLESFTVNITQEDDYGLCVFSNRHEAGNYKIKISNAWIWTGAVSSNWHEPGNWNTNLVPDNLSNVVITGNGHNPIISESFAMCADLNILNAGRLRLNGSDLMVTGNLHLYGWLMILNPDNRVDCAGDFVAEQYSYLELTPGSGINAFGDWTFGENSNILLNSGFVDFRGSFNSTIYCLSETSRFYDLKISKMSGATVRYDNHIGIQPLRVKNEFLINFGGTFIQSAMHTVIMDGTFNCVAGGNFYFQYGTVRFERPNAGGFSINSNAGSYFNDVVVSVGDWLGLASDVEIRGDLLIEEGTFKTNGYDISIKGNWTNNATFNHGNARVTFNGTGIQEVRGTNFWELELNKSLGELRVPATTVSVQHYDWTQGTLRVNGGWFQLNDLIDPGIYGTVIVTSGKLDLHQLPDEYLDLNGNLQISGGEMNIYGGNDDSYWPYSANASFTMSDGVLDFKSNGLRIHNSTTYSLTENITGGVIKINGDLTVARTDFNPAGGKSLFYGYTEDASVSVATGSNLFSLEVDKSSKKKAQAKTLTAAGTLDLNGDFTLEGGVFKAPTKMYIKGSFVNNQTPAHFNEMTGEVVLDGSVDQLFDADETFYKLTINKPGDGTVTIGSSAVFTAINNLLVDRGNLVLEPGTSLLLDGGFETNSLGNVYLSGESGSEITVTSATKGRFGFDISGGGFVSAKNTVFSNMDADGIYLHSGCYIDSENAFSECTFSNGAPGGTLITWDNGAEVIVHNAIFPANTTGCSNNVKKTTNSGRVYFDNATGTFAGATFESDPFSRIDWEYVPPLTIPFIETWATSSFTTNHWVPEGNNWQITGTLGNPFPTAFFNYTPRMYNYSVPLRSHLIDGTDYTGISIKFDIRYVNYSSSTLEQLKIQVVHKNGDFNTLATYNNAGGSFGFVTKEFDVSAFADGEIFYLRFIAFGADSWNINGWYIDNIMVSGIPPAPGLLKGMITCLTTGLPIKNAEVTIDGTAFSAMSGATGNYFISNIPKGVYSATVTASGYELLTAGGIEILSGISTVRNFSLEPIPPSYCTENLYNVGCLEGDGFDYFELRDILNDSSGCSENGYGDFTLMTTDLPRDYYYQVNFSTNFTDQFVSLWIDFNDDFEFSVSERLLNDFVLSNALEIYREAILIPGDAPTGQHRLRIRSNWDESSSDPCAQYQYGEAEDYTVTITTGVLTGSLMATVTSAASGDPIENAAVELSGSDWIGITEEEGICIIQWIIPGSYDIQVSASDFETFTLYDQYVFGGEVLHLEIELEPSLPLTHSISIRSGWSGLSSYIYPNETNIETLFSPVVDDLVILKSLTGMYWPSQNINSLVSWEHHSAYMIKASEDIELTLTGYPESNHTCALVNGWTMLPVVCNHNPNTENLFFPELSNLLLVKEIAGTGVFWPAMGINSLPQLQVGKAYMVKMQAACSVTFPVNNKNSGIVVNPNNPVGCELWDNPVPGASSHIIAIPESAWITGNISAGDFVGVFTNEGICAGWAQINGTTALSAFADDLLTPGKEGLSVGEPMKFRIFRPTSNDVLEVEFEFDLAHHDGHFNPLGVSVVNGIVTLSSAAVPETQAPLVYPNPTSGKLQITGIAFPATIQIQNHRGEVVMLQEADRKEMAVDLGHHPPGIYLLSITSISGVFNQKVVVY